MANDKSPELLLSVLLDEWSRATNGANTLNAQFLADISAKRALVSSGSVASVGKNSAHQAYAHYGAGQWTTVQEIEALVYLLSLYEQIAAKIVDLFTDDTTDWPNGVPANYDFDEVIADPTIDPTTGESKGILVRELKAMVAGGAQLRPDISRLRLPGNMILANQPPLTTW